MPLQKTAPYVIRKLYKLMYETDKILKENDIRYWADAGTMLGAVRHNGIIPWDDDIDIAILNSQRRQFWKLKDTFEAFGYEVIRVKTLGFVKIREKGTIFPFIDVFFYKLDGNKYIKTNKTIRDWWPNEWFGKNQIFPTVQCRFGNFYISCPREASKCLARFYGKDWYDVAYRMYDHEKDEHVENIKVLLTDADRVPARPFI